MSKRSAHHRVKRNQQLIEAQRLLENHAMTDNSNEGKRKLREHSNITNEVNEQLESHQSTKLADNIVLQGKNDNRMIERSNPKLRQGQVVSREKARIPIGSNAQRRNLPVKDDVSRGDSGNVDHSMGDTLGDVRGDALSPSKQKMYELVNSCNI